MTIKAVSEGRFRWLKPSSGHVWGVSNARLKPASRATTDVSEILAVTPGLFREFARLNTAGDEIQRDEIRNFADGFGDILALPHEEHASLETWTHAIQRMHRAVELWDRSNDPDRGEPSKQRASRELRLEINHALRDTKTPSHTTSGLTLGLRLEIFPVNLLAYMWLTLARIASREIEERRCIMCPERFYVGSGFGLQRADTLTCSVACRKRKQRAV